MNKPVRTTIVFALASGFIVVPLSILLSPYLYQPLAFKLVLWVDLGLYAVLLARWRRVSLVPLFFPLALLLAAALWAAADMAFFFLAAGVLCWIRSGICYRDTPVRTLAAEVITVIGGITLVMVFGGHSSVSVAISLCLFILVQALYFFIIPDHRETGPGPSRQDPFQAAADEVRKLLEGL